MNRIIWVSAALAAAAYRCGPIVDPDLWWHITIGRWIVSHGEIPRSEHWNMFALGHPWRAYSWSNEIILALIDRWWGMQGLYVAQLFLAALLCGTLMCCFGRMAGDWFVGALLGIFAATATFNHFTLRPQAVVWVLFGWLLLAGDEIDRRGPRPWLLAAVFGLMLIWANTHLSAALGIGAVVLWSWRGVRRAVPVAAAGFIGTLFTPYMGGEWLTFLSKSGHPFQLTMIAEFQAATIMQYSTGFLIIAAAVVMAFMIQRPRALAPAKLLCCGLFVAAGLAIVKFLPFSCISLCAVVAAFWRESGADGRAQLGNLAEALERLRGLYLRLRGPGLAFLFLCLAAVNVSQVWAHPVAHEVVPVAAVDFIQSRNLPHPILNSFGRGGYMMYRFSDAGGNLTHPVTIDGRTNVNPPEVWEKYRASLTGRHDWRGYIDLVKPETILWETESPFTSLLLAGGQWCEVFRTGNDTRGFMVFLKRSVFDSRKGEFTSPNCS